MSIRRIINISKKMNFQELLKYGKRNLARRIFSHLFFENNGIDQCIIVAGSGRSGTTWLANLLSQIFNYRIIFEPFWHLHLKVDSTDDFFHHRYIDEDNDDYNPLIRYVLNGKYKNKRPFMNYGIGPYDGRIIKEICANLFLDKIKQIEPLIPIIFIVRHPCAVISSRLDRKKWGDPWGRHAHIFNQQENLIAKYFREKTIPRNELEDHAITYCYENYLPLKKYFNEIKIVYYEKLFLNLNLELSGIVQYIKDCSQNQIKQKKAIKDIVNLPISTTIDKIRKLEKKDKKEILYSWKLKLNKGEVIIIRKIIEKFQLDFIFDKEKNILEVD